MTKYIKRKDAIRCFKATMIQDAYPEPLKDRLAIAALSGAESIDIVRCEECKWYIPTSGIYGKCTYRTREHLLNEPSDYCSYGERKDEQKGGQ